MKEKSGGTEYTHTHTHKVALFCLTRECYEKKPARDQYSWSLLPVTLWLQQGLTHCHLYRSDVGLGAVSGLSRQVSKYFLVRFLLAGAHLIVGRAGAGGGQMPSYRLQRATCTNVPVQSSPI